MQVNSLESISNNTKGVPDSWHIDTDGKSNPEVFQKHLGLPRKYRNDRKLVEAAMSRQTRLKQFVSALLHYRSLSTAILLEGDRFASPEAQGLARFDEGWHLRNEEDLVEFAKLDEADRKLMLADLRESRQAKEWKLQQVKVQALANRANTTVDRAFDVMISCAVESWLRSRNQLTKWVRFSDEERSLLADAIFCGFTLFGKRALEEADAIEPQVLSCYRVFLGLPLVSTASPVLAAVPAVARTPVGVSLARVPQEVSGPSALVAAVAQGVAAPSVDAPRSTASIAIVEPSASEVDAPQSLHQLYALIGMISQDAQAESQVGAEPAFRIKDLLDRHLQRLIALNARLSAEEVAQIIDQYCSAVLRMTEVLNFDNSEQRDLVPVLKAAWKVAVISALKAGRPQAWFETNLQERQYLPDFIERFQDGQSTIAQASAGIEEIKSQLAAAKYTARTSLKAGEKRKQTEISVAQGELEAIRVEAAHHLVPEGRTLDNLMEDGRLQQEIEFEVDEFNTAAVRALQAVAKATVAQGNAGAGMEVEEAPQQEALPVPALAPAVVTTPVPVKDEPAPAGKAVPAPVVIFVAVELAQGTQSLAVPPEVQTQPVKPEEPAKRAAIKPPEAAPQAGVPGEQPSAPGEETVQEAELPSQGVEGALRHLQYAESKEEAQLAFRISYEQFSQVPSSVIDAIAMHWLEAGHLNVAYQMLRDAKDTTLVSDRVLEASLLRSAFYGMNLWPKDREALSHTQRDLNLLNHKDLEQQLDRKPTGKLVPYLLVCATLQPALFAGGETQAPTLLKAAANYFDGHLKQLISSVAEFTMRGGRVDLDALRNDEGQEVHLAAAKIQDQVNAWVDINAQRTTRWHALRVALKISSEEPIIAPAIAALRQGERGDSAAVRLFVNTYSSHAESRRLLDDLVQRIRVDYSGPIDHIDNHAYVSFCQQIDSLVAIAQAWLLEVVPAQVRPKEASDFLARFHTQLDRSIASLMAHPRYADQEHRAGNNLLLHALTTLQTEVKGDTHSTWRFEQTDATFRLPETLARLDIGDVGVEYRLEWFAMRLTSPNLLADMMELAEHHNAHWVQLLLLRQMEPLGAAHDAVIDGVNSKIAGTRAELKKSIEQFKNMSIQAMSVDVISENDHLFNMPLASEWLDKLNTLKPFVDVSVIDEEVKKRCKGLEKLLNSLGAELDKELNQGLLVLRTQLGADAVPEAWHARVRTALDRRNLTVARELINQLQDHINRNARLVDQSPQENADLAHFLLVESKLYTVLQEHPNPREAGERVILEPPGGFDYSINKAAYKDNVGILLEWGSRGQNKKPTLEKRTYEGLVEVLEFAGFSVVDKSGIVDTLRGCEYSAMGDFRRLKVRIVRPTLPKGFPLFEDDHSDQVSLNVIFAQGTWNISGLTDLDERQGLPTRSVLLVGAPLSPDERRAFSSFCRHRKCTIFLLDPVVLSYLATAHSHQALKTFLHVTAGWTFYNPYTRGDTRQPAPPEMRFGREHEVAALVEPRGAALVYGGRQLGKTTLLHSAVQKFKQMDPTRNHAFHIQLDGFFQHVVERDTNVKARVLERLVNKLDESKLLSPSTKGKSAEERLQTEFQREGTTRVLFCLDEIDPVLNKDAYTNFQLVRSLVSLVNDPRQRFRVVFAGLNNVNRFRTYPNVPLEQLGSPLQVTILPAADARSLILQPLTALGYCFEEGELVDRIMAFTNCHPSLLHIFCSELVEQMARDRTGKGGMRVIRQTELENVENNSDVRRLSGERFDMTLNLDKRYTVAVYGLIDLYGKSIGKFTVKQALDVARNRVPEEFEQMSESGFESLLQELVGLGVLREADRTTHQYAMRNQSILQLIGTANDISHKLQMAVLDLANHAEDVLTCHPTGMKLEPLPLSLQDERQILKAKSPDGAPKYSVSLIMGTPALGLSLKGMKDSFSAINESQSGSVLSKYDVREVTEPQLLEPKRFHALLDTAIDTWAQNQAAVLLVSLEDVHSIDRIMDLISIANEKASKATRLKYALRIVFLLGARSMWSWHSHPGLTASPSEIGGLVELNRWTRHACESLLDQQGLGMTSEQARLLQTATEGWYLPLMKFIDVRKKRGDTVSSFKDFANDFTALSDLPAKDFEKFVEQTGMTSMAWSMPLAAQLKVFETLNEFSVEDLQTAIEFVDKDFQAQISPEQAGNVVRWWSALRVVEVNNRETSKNAGKGDKVTYRFTPSLQRAISERATGAAATSAVSRA